MFGEKLESYKKTKDAELLLKKHKAWDDIIKVHVSLGMRAGKSRGETDVMASVGDLASSTVRAVIIIKVFGSIPGVTLLNVSKLDIVKLPARGHVWCPAFGQSFPEVRGIPSISYGVALLKCYGHFLMYMVTNTDLSRILKSPKIQGALYVPREKIHCRVLKKDPLKT
ncbi:60S ribosomal protein L4 [Microtus ochrogaster]|uniref:60S ribosomal protein L4 n=1 Tax=Microtus ochrogaster TaxID=79684 RepID=A0A8J6KT33_MICOH|nr:60S ribosomal protein L4 [Microtus ochrogaster]